MFFYKSLIKKRFCVLWLQGLKNTQTAKLRTEMLWATMYYLVTHHHPKTNGLFGLKYIWILKEKKERVF